MANRWVKIASNGASGVGAIAPNDVTIDSIIATPIDESTVRVTIEFTPPSPLGTFLGVHAWEKSDAADNPIDRLIHVGSPAVIDVPRTTTAYTTRFYLASFSAAIDNELVFFGDPGATPSATVSIPGVADGGIPQVRLFNAGQQQEDGSFVVAPYWDELNKFLLVDWGCLLPSVLNNWKGVTVFMRTPTGDYNATGLVPEEAFVPIGSVPAYLATISISSDNLPTVAEDWSFIAVSSDAEGQYAVDGGGAVTGPTIVLTIPPRPASPLDPATQIGLVDWSIDALEFRSDNSGNQFALVKATIINPSPDADYYSLFLQRTTTPVDGEWQSIASDAVAGTWLERLSDGSGAGWVLAIVANKLSYNISQPPAGTTYKALAIPAWGLAPQVTGLAVAVDYGDRGGISSGRFLITFTPPNNPEYWYSAIERIACNSSFIPLGGAVWTQLYGIAGVPNGASQLFEQGWWTRPTVVEYWQFRSLSTNQAGDKNTGSPPTVNVTVTASVGISLSKAIDFEGASFIVNAGVFEIKDLGLTEEKIASNAISVNKIVDGAIQELKIGLGAVTELKLGANAVTVNKIAADAVTTGKLAANAVDNTKIAAGAVIAGKIAAGAVIAGTIAAGAVVAGTIDTNAVTAGTIAAGAVIAGKIGADAVAANNIVAGAIVAGKLATDSIIASNISVGAVIAGKIAANAVTAGTIEAGAVTTSKLTTSQIDLGGGGAKPIRFRVYDASNNPIGWIGDDTANSGYVGAWFKQLLIGGTSPSTAKISADSSGNVTIVGAPLTIVSGNVTVRLSADDVSGYVAGVRVYTGSANIFLGVVSATSAARFYFKGGGSSAIIFDATTSTALITLADATGTSGIEMDSNQAGSGGWRGRILLGTLWAVNSIKMGGAATEVINSSSQFVGAGASCNAGIAASGFNIYGGSYFGQTLATMQVVTDIQDNLGTIEKKTRVLDIRGGIITSIGSESAWTAI